MEEQEDLFREYRRFFRGPFPVPPRPERDPEATEPRGREFGLRVEGLEDPLRERLGLKPGEGLRVVEVRPGTPAARAGLLKDDILLKVDGKPVTDIWQLRRDARAAMLKPEFELEVLRAGERKTIRVKGDSDGAEY
jgi:S1-C subfamily serine protease